ncbi:GSU2403 family nucleotidyltransferase fold protein [Fibrobacterota bacterium]
MPEQNEELFFSVLKKLKENGVLEDMVLIGSWCLFFYKQLFQDDPLLPAVKTMDMDLLVPRPRKRRVPVDVSALLESLGFKVKFDYTSGYYKYIRSDFTVEFLMPLRGSGEIPVEKVKPLNISVQGLRHLEYHEDELINLEHKGCNIKLPRPEVFTLKKFLIHEKRLNPLKKEKDLATAQQMGRLLLSRDETLENLRTAFQKFSKKQQKNLLRITKETAIRVYEVLAIKNS